MRADPEAAESGTQIYPQWQGGGMRGRRKESEEDRKGRRESEEEDRGESEEEDRGKREEEAGREEGRGKQRRE